jgi:hypothetical protein
VGIDQGNNTSIEIELIHSGWCPPPTHVAL